MVSAERWVSMQPASSSAGDYTELIALLLFQSNNPGEGGGRHMAYCRLARPRVNTRTDEKKFNPLTVNCSVADPDPVLGSRTSKKNVNRSRAFLFYPLPWTLVLTEEDRTRSCSTNSDKFPNIFGGRYLPVADSNLLYILYCMCKLGHFSKYCISV